MPGKGTLPCKSQRTTQKVVILETQRRRDPGGCTTTGISLRLRSRPAHCFAQLHSQLLLMQNSAFVGVSEASHTWMVIQISSSTSSQAQSPPRGSRECPSWTHSGLLGWAFRSASPVDLPVFQDTCFWLLPWSCKAHPLGGLIPHNDNMEALSADPRLCAI